MDENRVKQLIQQEILRSNNASRFAVNSIPQHTHDGINSPQIKAENVIPSVSVTGFVSFAQATRYRLNLNSSFTPQRIDVNGIATGAYSGNQTRVLLVGTALLTPTFYFQEDDSTSVITGNIQFPFNGKPAQSGSFLSVTRGGTSNFFAGITEDHIVSVNFPTTDTIQARVTVVGYTKDYILIEVPTLTSGWEVTLNFNIS